MKQILALIVTACLLLGLVGCEKPHEHSFSDEWSFDDASHFHKAVCGDTDEVSDKAPHEFKDGECEVCGYKQVSAQIDDKTLSKSTEPATSEQKERAKELVTAFIQRNGNGGFLSGDLFCKDHTAEGASAQNSEYKIDGFNGGFGDLGGAKVSFTRMTPSYSGTQKEFYYADDDCAIEDYGIERTYYEVSGTAANLVEKLLNDLVSQINYAGTLVMLDGCKVGYLMDGFELISLDYQSGSSDKSSYVFAFSDGKVAGLKVNRAYQTASAVNKQFEILIGEYEVQKPDTTGFKTVSYRPKWAAGYPSIEVFDREFVSVPAADKARVTELFNATTSKLSKKDNTVILADGDVKFTYESSATRNEVIFDRDGLSMKVHEKSLIFESDIEKNVRTSFAKPVYTDDSKLKPVPQLPEQKEDKLVEIEHYADLGICFETIKGKTTAFIGDYANNFYSMMKLTLINLCDFINQYKDGKSSGEFEVFINDDEFTSLKIDVPGCGYMIYVYDAEGKLLGVKVKFNDIVEEVDSDGDGKTDEVKVIEKGAFATLLIGKYNVTLPTYDNYETKDGQPYTSYLG